MVDIVDRWMPTSIYVNSDTHDGVEWVFICYLASVAEILRASCIEWLLIYCHLLYAPEILRATREAFY
jgi:hypothetical protein